MKITVNPRLFKMLGKGMYNSHSLIITVRELIQNGRDSAIRAKRDPQLILDLQYTELDGLACWRVSLLDNGEGMSADDIENKLLSLAGDCKSSESIGGFGIAKLVLLTGLRFEVYTRDIYFDSDLLNKDGNPIKTGKYIDGARVTVWLDDRKVYGDTIKYAIGIARFSACPITINYRGYDQEDSVIKSTGYKCGPAVHSGDDNGNHWTMAIDPGNDMYNVFRLGGLVQFITRSCTRIDTNLIIDVSTNARPGDADYPFTTSRESLQSSMYTGINDVITTYEIDPLTASKDGMESRESPDIKIKDGVMYHYCKGWKPDKFDRRILRCWDFILSHITYEDYKTGYVKKYAIAERYQDYNGLFYLIDPDQVNGKTVDGIVYDLYDLAVHEVNHKVYSAHNESFESSRHLRFTDNSEDLTGLVSHVKRYILRNR